MIRNNNNNNNKSLKNLNKIKDNLKKVQKNFEDYVNATNQEYFKKKSN